MPRRVLVLGGGSVASNNLIRALRSADPSMSIAACSDDRFVLKRSIADRNYLVSSSSKRAFLGELRHAIEAEGARLLIPNGDADVASVSKLRKRIPCGTFLPKHAVIERCADKLELNTFLRLHGVAVPDTYAVPSLKQLDDIVERLSSHAQLWCRIRKGSGSIGAIPVATAAQARWWIDYWQTMRSVPPGMFTLSEYLPGRDITVQCVFKNGRLFIAKMLQRLAYNVIGGGPSGVSSTASLGLMVHEPRIVRTCVKAVTALDPKASGAYSVDVKENARGVACVTEINAGRFANGPVVHDIAGTPSTAFTYARLGLGERVEVVKPRPYREDHFVMRNLDIAPAVTRASELFDGIVDVRK